MVLVSTAIAVALGATAMADIAVLGQLGPALGPAPSPTAFTLLESARQDLASGYRHPSAADRWVAAHLAALRAAAAIVAARTDQSGPGGRSAPKSVWEQLPKAEPTLNGWAEYFTTAGRRKATGVSYHRSVSRRASYYAMPRPSCQLPRVP